MSVEVSIVCDGCGGIIDAAKTARDARERVRANWPTAKLALPGGRDYCAECAPDAAKWRRHETDDSERRRPIVADDTITVQAYADALASVPPEYAHMRAARHIWIEGYMAGALANPEPHVSESRGSETK